MHMTVNIDRYIEDMEQWKKTREEKEELQQRIEKAVEYIKQNEFYLDYKTGACIKGVMPLLNILNDKE